MWRPRLSVTKCQRLHRTEVLAMTTLRGDGSSLQTALFVHKRCPSQANMQK